MTTCAATPVYPRLRGERFFVGFELQLVGGLSPATRGTRRIKSKHIDYVRFIPGYAGNAQILTIQRQLMPVYPRLRGERLWLSIIILQCSGLSPATRGTLFGIKAGIWPSRFIPGYAGNAFRSPSLLQDSAVYPRLRGERFLVGAVTSHKPGLSPATRGTLLSLHPLAAGVRFIPGYAGNAWFDV